MTEKVSELIEVFSLKEKTDVSPVADAIMDGKITILKVGSVYSIVFRPTIAGLKEKTAKLKGRAGGQYMSVVCSYEQAKKVVDRKLVNEDFFRLSADFCSKALIRIPVEPELKLPFSYNTTAETMQFLSFEGAHPVRKALKDELLERGCEYISITSGNIHEAPTIEDLESAKKLATLFNLKASFLGLNDTKTVVADIPEDKSVHNGSYIILSFCNPNAIEVKRLANKVDREFTESYLKELFATVDTKTQLVFDV